MIITNPTKKFEVKDPDFSKNPHCSQAFVKCKKDNKDNKLAKLPGQQDCRLNLTFCKDIEAAYKLRRKFKLSKISYEDIKAEGSNQLVMMDGGHITAYFPNSLLKYDELFSGLFFDLKPSNTKAKVSRVACNGNYYPYFEIRSRNNVQLFPKAIVDKNLRLFKKKLINEKHPQFFLPDRLPAENPTGDTAVPMLVLGEKTSMAIAPLVPEDIADKVLYYFKPKIFERKKRKLKTDYAVCNNLVNKRIKEEISK